MNSLVYVKYYAYNPSGSFIYDLYYSETPDVVWGMDWDNMVPSLCQDLTPDVGVSKIERITSKYKFKTIEDTSCLSMEYAINDVIALSWVDIEGMDSYPDEGRCVLHFGDSEDDVNNIIAQILV